MKMAGLRILHLTIVCVFSISICSQTIYAKSLLSGIVVKQGNGGAKVTNVARNNNATKAGLQDNDIIVSIDNVDIKSLDEYVDASRKGLLNKKYLNLKVKRMGEIITIRVKCENCPETESEELKYERAKSEGTVGSSRSYLGEPPDSIDDKEAETRIEERAFNNATKTHTQDAYLDFIKKYPKSKHYKEAFDAYKGFIKEGQVSKSSPQARERIERPALEGPKTKTTKVAKPGKPPTTLQAKSTITDKRREKSLRVSTDSKPTISFWWVTMTCGKDKHKLRLTVSGGGQSFEGVLEEWNNYNALQMQGALDSETGRFHLKPTGWIHKPSRRSQPIGLEGVFAKDNKTMKGQVTGGECSKFSARLIELFLPPVNPNGLLFKAAADPKLLSESDCLVFVKWLNSGKKLRLSQRRGTIMSQLLDDERMREVFGKSLFQWGPKDNDAYNAMWYQCKSMAQGTFNMELAEEVSKLKSWNVDPLGYSRQRWLEVENNYLAVHEASALKAEQKALAGALPRELKSLATLKSLLTEVRQRDSLITWLPEGELKAHQAFIEQRHATIARELADESVRKLQAFEDSETGLESLEAYYTETWREFKPHLPSAEAKRFKNSYNSELKKKRSALVVQRLKPKTKALIHLQGADLDHRGELKKIDNEARAIRKYANLNDPKVKQAADAYTRAYDDTWTAMVNNSVALMAFEIKKAPVHDRIAAVDKMSKEIFGTTLNDIPERHAKFKSMLVAKREEALAANREKAKDMEGTYTSADESANGMGELTFQNGKFTIISVIGTYELEGSKIKVKPMNAKELSEIETFGTLETDGSIRGDRRNKNLVKKSGSSGLEGTYTSTDAIGEFTFQNGKLTLALVVGTYELDGNKIKINGEGGEMVFGTLEEDGSITADDDGSKWVKKKAEFPYLLTIIIFFGVGIATTGALRRESIAAIVRSWQQGDWNCECGTKHNKDVENCPVCGNTRPMFNQASLIGYAIWLRGKLPGKEVIAQKTKDMQAKTIDAFGKIKEKLPKKEVIAQKANDIQAKATDTIGEIKESKGLKNRPMIKWVGIIIVVSVAMIFLLRSCGGGKPNESVIANQIEQNAYQQIGVEFIQIENLVKINGREAGDNTYMVDVEYDILFTETYWVVDVKATTRGKRELPKMFPEEFVKGDGRHEKQTLIFAKSENGWILVR